MEETNRVRDYPALTPLYVFLEDAALLHCEYALWLNRGHKGNTAQELGIHRNTLTKILNRAKKEKP